jgi:ankyrin repeat protein
MLRREQHDCQKRWDDLLLKCYAVLLKGDHLQKIEKLVSKGEADFGFDANYVSPVVCERNCLLNLAVIQQRHKVVRWLVDQKGAAIESYDRGHFTPLLNAAWAGHKQTVRFLLQRGANRSKVGFYHYSKPLSSPDFAGLSAEGWARRQGHDSIAELIRLGL